MFILFACAAPAEHAAPTIDAGGPPAAYAGCTAASHVLQEYADFEIHTDVVEEYDDLGWLVNVTSGAEEPWIYENQYDMRPDGGVTEARTYSFGELSWRMTAEFSDAGLATYRDWDSDGDGEVDATARYVYDGRRLVEDYTDANGDGSEESTFVYTYDDRGRLVDLTGTVASMTSYVETWTWADAGWTEHELFSAYSLEHVLETRTFDGRGRIAETSRSRGSVEFWLTYDYLDGDDLPDGGTHESLTYGDDVPSFETFALTHDELERRVSYTAEMDHEPDGVVDRVTTDLTTWTCR